MNTGHVLSRPSLDENQRLSSTGQVDLGNTQIKLAQFHTMDIKHSLSRPSLDEVFPYALELPTSGVNGPGEPFARSSTFPVSGATYPQESILDYFTIKPISEGHVSCPSQPLGAPTGSAHYLAFAPQAGISSSSYKLLEPSSQFNLGILGLVQPSAWANFSDSPFSTAYDGHNPHLSPCVPSLSQNLVAPSRAEMAMESAGSPLGRKSEVSRPDQEATQSGTTRTLLPSSQVHLDGAQVELEQSFGSIRSENVPFSSNVDLLVFPCAFESSQRHLDGTQVALEQSFGSIHSKIGSLSKNDDFLVFPYALELPTSGLNGPGEPFARSSTFPVSGATYPQESISDCFTMKPISECHGNCPSQPLGAPTGSAHYLAFAPQAGISSSSCQLLEPSRQYDLGTLGLAQPSTSADPPESSFSTAYDGHNRDLSPCVPSLSQNLVAPSREKMAIESAGSLLGRKSQVDRPDHKAIESGTARTCLQCNDSFKSISELGHHATKLQHDAFKCKCGQPFKRRDSLERHLIRYQPGARQYSCQLCDRYEGEKAFTREDNLKQHLQVYHRVNSTKYSEYKKCYLKA